MQGFPVGGSLLLTSGFHRAVQLTERLKRVLDIPVIWGDIHATVERNNVLIMPMEMPGKRKPCWSWSKDGRRPDFYEP
jgi:hypothetical protein